MDAESPHTNQKFNATQLAMRLVKRNRLPGGNDGASDSLEDQGRDDIGNEPTLLGDELAPDAKVWKMFLQEAQEYDWQVFEGRQRSLDTVLLFAGLLSIVLTVFLLEANKVLQQNPTHAANAVSDLITRLHPQLKLELATPAELARIVYTHQVIPYTPYRWINWAWCISLTLSLSTALLAMIGKQGLTHCQSPRPQSEDKLVRVRQSIARIARLEDWGGLPIVDFLPTMLEASFFLFLVGFLSYVWVLDAKLVVPIVGNTLVVFCIQLGTRIPGKQPVLGSFVAMYQCLRQAASMIFKLPSRTIHSELVSSSILDLQALDWLSERTEDPIIIDRAFQAMAGLHQSPYTEPYLRHPRPSLSLNPAIHYAVPVVRRGKSIDSLLLRVMQRFDQLLQGALETDSEEPPVCRYINAMISLGYYLKAPSDASLQYWLDTLCRIDSLWTSTLPEQSLSGNSFAGVLIAEMEVFKLIIDALQSKSEEGIPQIGDDPVANSAWVDPKIFSPANQPSRTSGTFPLADQLDKTRSGSFRMLYRHLVGWLELSLTLLQSNDNRETRIAFYLEKGLFQATSDGAYHLKRIHALLYSRCPVHPVPEIKGSSLNCLKILTDLLLQLTNPETKSIMQLTDALRTFTSIASLTVEFFGPQDDISFDHVSDTWNLDASPPITFFGTLGLCVHYVMSLLDHLSRSLTEPPQYGPMFHNALQLVHQSFYQDENMNADGPHQSFRHRMDNYIHILERIGEDESNFELMSRRSCSLLCLIAVYQSSDHKNGFYVPPVCFRTLIHLLARSIIAEKGVQLFMDLIAGRLRNPGISLAQLPPQSSPIPESSPSIEYLHQITWYSDTFSDLVQAGSTEDAFPAPVLHEIVDITIIAANLDPALSVEPVELREPAVPGFLEALSWTLPRLSDTEAGRDVHNRFVVAASNLLVVACQDSESRNLISHSWGRRRLLKKLQDDRDDHIGVIGEGEWGRLVDGLTLGEAILEEAEISDNEPDENSTSESDPDPIVANESDETSDSEAGSSIVNFL